MLIFLQEHTVVQAAFDKPCEPLAGGFFSGDMKVSAKSVRVGSYFWSRITQS
jgi:hypothetical protein